MIEATSTGRIIKFVVPGAPVPYLRMTQGQVKLMRIPLHKINSPGALRIRERIQRALDYKEWVRAHTLGKQYDRAPKSKTVLNVMCYFSNKKHADPENVRKLIQDAIFNCDKFVAGSVDFSYDSGNPVGDTENWPKNNIVIGPLFILYLIPSFSNHCI